VKEAPSRLSAIGLVVALVGLAGLAQSAPPPPSPVEVLGPHVASQGPIDVNLASAAELATLPRIGPTLAARIVEDRLAHGPYRTIDELDRVPGLGPSTIAQLRPHATAGPRSRE
jgi:competence protein ComEA